MSTERWPARTITSSASLTDAPPSFSRASAVLIAAHAAVAVRSTRCSWVAVVLCSGARVAVCQGGLIIVVVASSCCVAGVDRVAVLLCCAAADLPLRSRCRSLCSFAVMKTQRGQLLTWSAQQRHTAGTTGLDFGSSSRTPPLCSALLCCSDVGVKEYLVWLEKSGAIAPFIKMEIDDTHLFVEPRPHLFEELQVRCGCGATSCHRSSAIPALTPLCLLCLLWLPRRNTWMHGA